MTMANLEIYEVEVRHEELNRVRQIRGTNRQEVDAKAKAQYAAWDRLWKRRQALLTQHPEANKKAVAEQKNRELQTMFDQMCNLLKSALEKPHEILWETLKDYRDFPEPMPQKPDRLKIPPEPRIAEDRYHPSLSVLDHFFSQRRFKKIEHASQMFKHDHREWEVRKKELSRQSEENQKQYAIDIKRWAEEKRQFVQAQKVRNAELDKRRDAYLKKTTEGVLEYCRLVLENAAYPACFPRLFESAYEPASKSLTVEYQLPAFDDLPGIKGVSYDQLRNEINEIPIPEPTLRKLYESTLYQMPLRVLYELYEADVVGMIDSIAFHGWVRSMENDTGAVEKVRIVSIRVGRQEFFGLNLLEIQPRECLARLKGTVNRDVLSMAGQ
jgi:restriction system protein